MPKYRRGGYVGFLTGLLVLMASIDPAAHAQIELAHAGEARAVIVADEWVPEATAAFRQLSVSAGEEGDLLGETFEGATGQPIETRGWTNVEGAHVVSHDGEESGYSARPRSPGSPQFAAVSDKKLSRPHTVTEDAPLTLEYVLARPADTSHESWAHAGIHTEGGERWAHGVHIARGGDFSFEFAAEGADPDRVPMPGEAGRVLDLKMEMRPATVRWYWRNHGSGEPYKRCQEGTIAGPVTITGVRISTMSHLGDSKRDLAGIRQNAATGDLKKYLDVVTGAEFAIARPMEVPDGVARILVGDSQHARALAPDVDWDSLGTDDIVIKTVGNYLILAGGQPRGTVYAIYTFLQDALGCRWWAPGAASIPSQPNLSVPPMDVVYRPPFNMRVHAGTYGATHEPRVWHRMSFDVNYDWTTHSFPKLLPPSEHFLEHPDWYMYCKEDGSEDERYSYLYTLSALERESKTDRPDSALIRQYVEVARQTRRLPGQPCPNSEGGERTITANVLAELERDYPGWIYPQKIAWVLQGDGRNMCTCDRCDAMRREEGSDAANWMRLVNAIAEKVERKYPDVLVGMFAYLHTEAPPRTMRPRKNVLVYQALLDMNRLDPVPSYAFHREAMKKWADMSSQVFVWDYDGNFRHHFQPHPNYFNMGVNARFFQEIGVDGILLQASYGTAADMGPMRTWVAGQMMWDPRQDQRELMIEFLNGYYGPAGPYLMEYIDAMVAAAHRHGDDFWLSCFETDTANWATLEDLNEATRLFDEAAAAIAGDGVLSERLWLARSSIDMAWLDRYDELRQDAERRGVRFGGPENPAEVVDGWAPYRHAWGQFKLPGQFSEYFDSMRERFPSAN